MPEENALSLYEQVDALVRWSLARYDALLTVALFSRIHE
jgi:hypothetical protein